MTLTSVQAARSYAERREPYFVLIVKLGLATFLLLAGVGLFAASVSSKQPDAAEMAGWLAAPIFWLCASAYKNYKSILSSDWASPDLMKSKAAVLASAAIFSIAVILTASSGAIFWQSKRAHQARLSQLFQKERSIQPAKREFMFKLKSINGKDPQTFSEFKEYCASLKSVLDQGEPIWNEQTVLLDSLQKEYRGADDIQQIIALLKQGQSQDQTAFGYFREEITCSEVLSRAEKATQDKFSAICIAPLRNKISPVLEKQQQTLHQLQNKGVRLPPEVAEALR